MSNIILRPCPFCGGEAEISDKRPKRRTYVSCTSCGTRAPIRNNAQEASEFWNARAAFGDSRDG
ncbi:Lar family restriction alleviation protein [Nitrobacter sp.]|uniref:Lar family restriction alleviation protein n=1 Tax=Nitrobacter sp. TaxID=29420 RepID=UPI001DFF2110|nr:Lar family restriction alleviation protein [Nitrobacter sp.]